jgi:hypothetical protein
MPAIHAYSQAGPSAQPDAPATVDATLLLVVIALRGVTTYFSCIGQEHLLNDMN